jgi:hypothetical protein
MATFLMADADVAAVFIKTGKEGSSSYRLRRAPYNLVTYDDGTTGLVPIPHLHTMLSAAYTVSDLEVDRIEIYDGGDPLEFSKIGPF